MQIDSEKNNLYDEIQEENSTAQELYDAKVKELLSVQQQKEKN